MQLASFSCDAEPDYLVRFRMDPDLHSEFRLDPDPYSDFRLDPAPYKTIYHLTSFGNLFFLNHQIEEMPHKRTYRYLAITIVFDHFRIRKIFPDTTNVVSTKRS